MRRSLQLFAATMFGAAVLVQPAAAQDMTTATAGGTTVWIGGGVQFLSLPDIRFTGQGGLSNLRRQKNTDSDWLDFGGAVGAGFETALGYWGGYRVTGRIEGFWANVDDDDRTSCSGGATYCVVIDPTGAFIGTSGSLVTKATRNTDYWGGSAELKFGRPEPVRVKPNLYRNDYFIVGADIRGIDQNNTLRSQTGTVFTYRESLDTTYTGGYIGLGGEYSFGFLKGIGGFYDRLGLRTFISGRAGLYSAETDYTGRFVTRFTPFSSKLSKSNDELAFIGTVSLETRKQFGGRTSLSLWTDYEYISSVPKMRYADFGGRPTTIESESIFATRTMLRLNIGLGSQALYPEPYK